MTMRVTMIGASNLYGVPDEPMHGCLVTHGETAILFDCGPGVATKVGRYVPIHRLTAVVLSHLDMDTIFDLPVLGGYLATYNLDLIGNYLDGAGVSFPTCTIPLLLPPDSMENIAQFLAGFPVFTPPLAEMLIPQEFALGAWRIGALAVECFGPLPHKTAGSFGFRVTDGVVTVGITGETAMHPTVDVIAAQVDVLVCDAWSLTNNIRSDILAHHLTADQAGRLAQRAGVKHLVLTNHINFDPRWLNMVARAARAEYPGPITIASSGTYVEVSAPAAR